jgi:carbon monoxide dehydrogenase subunit G
MVKIESNKSIISASAQEVYDYLAVPQNYKILMPSKVRSFEASTDSATLDIEGIGKVELAITERISPSKIVMLPQNKVPFKFDIQWNIVTQGEGAEVQAVVNADLNFMMKMMAEGLLKDFVNVQVHKLTEYLKK